jgi:hypothetical protein
MKTVQSINAPSLTPTCHFLSNGRSYHYDILRGRKVCIIALRSSFGAFVSR